MKVLKTLTAVLLIRLVKAVWVPVTHPVLRDAAAVTTTVFLRLTGAGEQDTLTDELFQ